MNSKNYIIYIVVVFVSAVSFAQLKTPAASPSAKMIQTIGLTDVEIHYSRPSAKGREVFGENGVVLYDKIWRTGANAATKISFKEDLKIAKKLLLSGSYAILTKPGASSWTVYFYTYESGNWTSYLEKQPKLTVTVPAHQTADTVETFTIHFDDLTMNSALLVFSWQNTKVTVPMTVEVHEKTMTSIQKTLSGPSDIDYFRAATYLHEAGKDLNTALQYIQKATKGDNPKFFQFYREAQILADLGRTSEAIAAAKKSLELAKKAGNDDFVRLNLNAIKKWE